MLVVELVLDWCKAHHNTAGVILGLCPANERRLYFVTTFLIGWAQAWNQPCTVWYIAMTQVEHTLAFDPSNYIPYLIHMGKLMDLLFHNYFGEYWKL